LEAIRKSGNKTKFLISCGFKTMYSVKADSEMNIGQDNIDKVIEFLREQGYNFTLSKNEGGVK